MQFKILRIFFDLLSIVEKFPIYLCCIYQFLFKILRIFLDLLSIVEKFPIYLCYICQFLNAIQNFKNFFPSSINCSNHSIDPFPLFVTILRQRNFPFIYVVYINFQTIQNFFRSNCSNRSHVLGDK